MVNEKCEFLTRYDTIFPRVLGNIRDNVTHFRFADLSSYR